MYETACKRFWTAGPLAAQRLGPPSRDALEDAESYWKPSKAFSVGGTFRCTVIGWEGSVSQYYVIPGCWRALLGNTWETLIEIFLFGNSPLFPWLNNTNQMWSRPAGEGPALGREDPSHAHVQPWASQITSWGLLFLIFELEQQSEPHSSYGVVRIGVQELGKILSSFGEFLSSPLEDTSRKRMK